MATKQRKKPTNSGNLLEGRTTKEAADNLRKQARDMANYRNAPEVRRAIARNPKILAKVIELERKAADVMKAADDLETACGGMNADEFSALNEQAKAYAAEHPEEYRAICGTGK